MTTSISDDAVLEFIFNPEAQGQPFSSLQQAVENKPEKEFAPELLKELQALEKQAVGHANEGRLQEALDVLDQCITREPDYASAYNNRAQVHRLMKNNEAAMNDLDKVISTLGKGQPSILRQAYTQRAILKRSQGDSEGSRIDFEQGARFGNPIARTIAVQENPYAKMCNQMVMEMMSREMNPGCHNNNE
ncbi:hypothetical protein K492DRAFT_155584 [Lichtheimia hyalospora FSU 10163]|nr:hypothetical protein K492DRAFT_155584 [Lichtheimia hyalospora FSU 10163]